MKDPVAFLITWTCYGTWLHGDARGSVDTRHNQHGTPTLPDSVRRVVSNQVRMNDARVRFDLAARAVVHRAIEERFRFHDWDLMAVNVRSNHVHAVVGFAGERPERVMGQLKAWATRRLRDSGIVGAGERTWTKHGSTRYIWESRSIPAAVAYVEEGQDVAR